MKAKTKFKVLSMPKDKTVQTLDELIVELKALDPRPKYFLVLYANEHDGLGSTDNGISVAKCLYMAECFKHWLLTAFLHPKEKK